MPQSKLYSIQLLKNVGQQETYIYIWSRGTESIYHICNGVNKGMKEECDGVY